MLNPLSIQHSQSTPDRWPPNLYFAEFLDFFPLWNYPRRLFKIRLVTFVPHSSELFPSSPACRTLSSGPKYASTHCQNQPPSARSHSGCASRSSSGHGLFRQVVRNPGPHPRPHGDWGAARLDSPPVESARHPDHFLSPAQNGIHGGMDKIAGWKKRIPGWPAGFFSGKGQLGNESFHLQHTAANRRLSHVGSSVNGKTLCATS